MKKSYSVTYTIWATTSTPEVRQQSTYRSADRAERVYANLVESARHSFGIGNITLTEGTEPLGSRNL